MKLTKKIMILWVIIPMFFTEIYAQEDPVGGWAVVAPDGTVVSVIVCTESVCGLNGSWGGVMPEGTEHAGYQLVLQTNATADGNVAGWTSQEGTEVTYSEESNTFDITSTYENEGTVVTNTMTLVPELTAKDPDGMDLSTGIIHKSISYELYDKFVEIFPDNDWEDKSKFVFEDVTDAQDKFQTKVTNVLVQETIKPDEVILIEEEQSILNQISNFVTSIFDQLFGWLND